MFEVTVRVLSAEQQAMVAVRNKFNAGLKDCGDVILPIAQSLALPHMRSGRYLRSLNWHVDEKTVVGSLGSNRKIAPHAHLVEYGTQKMPPQGILRKSAEQAREKMGQVIAKRMQEV